MKAVRCEELRRVYKSKNLMGKSRETVALAGLSLDVDQGTVFGLLGPNGAGKTTTIRVLTTLLLPSSGFASVMGFDVERQPNEVRKRIGLVTGGERGFYGRLSALQNLRYFGALNHLHPKLVGQRSLQLLEQFGLSQQVEVPVEQFSRGMRQRLHLARGLIADPEIIFLDEPTLGLDPAGAAEVREMVRKMVDLGKTVVLTTHYMFEADSLCNAIAIIDKGELVAKGTPMEIKGSFSKINIVEITLSSVSPELTKDIGELPQVQQITSTVDGPFQKLVISTTAESDMLDQISELLGDSVVESKVARGPTLEEAYLNILGQD